MNLHYLYLAIDLGCISLPLIASFHPKIKFYREFPFVLPAIAIVASVFLFWDEWFTKMGVWGFNPDYVLGIYWASLPLEEILFFICIPYACLFTYYCVRKLWPQHPFYKLSEGFWIFFFVLSILMASFNYTRLYTVITFSSLALILLLYRILFKNKSFATVVWSYLLISPFFLISNGILTGSGIIGQVVWYNDNENIGRRIGTIPFEDFFYGFLLILMNIVLINLFKRWRKPSSLSVAQDLPF